MRLPQDMPVAFSRAEKAQSLEYPVLVLDTSVIATEKLEVACFIG